MLQKKLIRSVFACILSLSTGLGIASELTLNEQEKKELDASAKGSKESGNIVHKAIDTRIVEPVGTQFYITELHPLSAWELSDFQGVVLTAVQCSSDITEPGINLLLQGSRQGYHDACFTKSDSTFEYFVYGFNYSLVAGTETEIPLGSSESGTVYPNLDIHMPFLNYEALTGNRNIWVNLEYLGTNSEGKHTWGLKNFGEN